jgi:cell division protein FtsQ
VANPEDLKAVVSSGGSDILMHFGDEEFLHRYQEFEQHLPEWKQQYPRLAAADMRYERQVVLEMQPGTGVPVNGGAAAAEASTAGGTAGEAKESQVPEGQRAAPIARRVVATVPKAKTRVSAGKGKTGNGRIFADLAAARRAKAARAKHAVGAGGR